MDTGRNISMCRQTMAPVKLEFPASVRALLHSGELTVYDILELVVNGVNALCGSYDSNMVKLGNWTGGVADWASAADQELKDKQDAMVEWMDDQEDNIESWQKSTEGNLKTYVAEQLSILTDGQFGAGTVTMQLLDDELTQLIKNKVDKAYIGTDTDGDKAIVLWNNAQYSAPIFIKAKDLEIGIENGSITEDKLTVDLKAKINRSAIGEKSVGLTNLSDDITTMLTEKYDEARVETDSNGDKFLVLESRIKPNFVKRINVKDLGIEEDELLSMNVTNGGKVNVVTSKSGTWELVLPFARNVSPSVNSNENKDNVGGLMTKAESEKLAGISAGLTTKVVDEKIANAVKNVNDDYGRGVDSVQCGWDGILKITTNDGNKILCELPFARNLDYNDEQEVGDGASEVAGLMTYRENLRLDYVYKYITESLQREVNAKIEDAISKLANNISVDEVDGEQCLVLRASDGTRLNAIPLPTIVGDNTVSAPAAPVIARITDSADGVAQFQITCSDADAAVYYTTDDGVVIPTDTNSTKLVGNVVKVSDTATIRAVSYKSGVPSAVAQLYYKKMYAPKIVSSGKNKYKITCDTDDAIVRYTTDGVDPTTSSKVCTSDVIITESCTIKAKAWATVGANTYESAITSKAVTVESSGASGGSAFASPISVMAMNVGGWCHNVDSNGRPGITYEESAQAASAFKDLMAEADSVNGQPTVVGICEYVDQFSKPGTSGQAAKLAKDVVFDGYETQLLDTPYRAGNYWRNVMMLDTDSGVTVINNAYNLYGPDLGDSSVVGVDDNGKNVIYNTQNTSYALIAETTINGKRVGIACLHGQKPLTDTYKDSYGHRLDMIMMSKKQIDRLMDVMDDYEYAIIMGDFNIYPAFYMSSPTKEEVYDSSIFAGVRKQYLSGLHERGFLSLYGSAAMYGVGGGSKVFSDCTVNIVFKGFTASNAKQIDGEKVWTKDHAGKACMLTINE